MPQCQVYNVKCYSNPQTGMAISPLPVSRISNNVILQILLFLLVNALATAMLLMACGSQCRALAHESLPHNSAAHRGGALSTGMGRLYIFRGVRSFGAHIDDYVTINGLPVHRIAPGSGFYCDI